MNLIFAVYLSAVVSIRLHTMFLCLSAMTFILRDLTVVVLFFLILIKHDFKET